MALYESNYTRFYELLPRRSMIRTVGKELVSSTPGDCDLYVSVLEVTTFTTTLNMTYIFSESDQQIVDPDLIVRMYHDAGLAEAMDCRRTHVHEALLSFDTQTGDELSKRWARNMMFNKWLEYCMDRRHRFRDSFSSNNPVAVAGYVS